MRKEGSVCDEAWGREWKMGDEEEEKRKVVIKREGR